MEISNVKNFQTGVNQILEPTLFNIFRSILDKDTERKLFQYTERKLFQYKAFPTKMSEITESIESKIRMIHIDFDRLEEIVPFTKVILFCLWKLILGK